VIQLVLRSLQKRPAAAALLAVAIALATAAPTAVTSIGGSVRNVIEERAATTPVVIGPAGSGIELAATSLFFTEPRTKPISARDWERLRSVGSGTYIPLYVSGYLDDRTPLVATTSDYFRIRESRVAGRPLNKIGDIVLGHSAAARLGKQPGNLVTTAPESILEITGPRPARLRVVGVLAPTGTADDRAAFVSLETAWAVRGLGHSHRPTDDESSTIIDLTGDGSEDIHFHASADRRPLTSILFIPEDERALLMLLGRLQSSETNLTAVEPPRLLDQFATELGAVENTLLSVALVNVFVTLLLGLAIVLLTVRLRREETRAMVSVGLSRGAIFRLYATELAIVSLAGIALGLGLAWIVQAISLAML